jgi:hypothetical protein
LTGSKEFEILAHNVQKNLVEFRKHFSSLPKKSMERVALTIIENPVEQSKTLSDNKEKSLASLGIALKQDMFAMAIEYLKTEQQNAENKEGSNDTKE